MNLDELRAQVAADEAARPAVRFAALDDVEFRADGDRLMFVGHAAVFDRLSEDLGGWRERIQCGAFRKVLDSNPDVRFLFNHDPGLVMARTTVTAPPGMLELREDPKGLRAYAELVPTQAARDLRELVAAGVVNQMSFSFAIGSRGQQVWTEEDDALVRTIVSFGDLYDVGPATFPAYPQTDATMRALVCGVEVVSGRGEVCEPALRELAWRIHRGEQAATAEERAALDRAFARTATVSPWLAERALGAVSQEPELQAAIPGMRATVLLEPDAAAAGPPYRLAARQRRLRLLTG